MRWLVLALIATALAPWPGIPALPNGTGVTVLRQDGLARRAIGEIEYRQLVLQAQNARLPANEEVAIWLSLPNETSPKVLLGRASSDGQDVWLTGSDAAGNTSGANSVVLGVLGYLVGMSPV
jgi:hypothetical protein